MSNLLERIRERTAMKYMGDCKCGKCQLVPKDMLVEIMEALSASPPAIGELVDAEERPAPFTCSEVATIVREHTDVIESLKAENERLRKKVKNVEFGRDFSTSIANDANERADKAERRASAVWEEAAKVVDLVAAVYRETAAEAYEQDSVASQRRANENTATAEALDTAAYRLRSRAKSSEVGGS